MEKNKKKRGRPATSDGTVDATENATLAAKVKPAKGRAQKKESGRPPVDDLPHAQQTDNSEIHLPNSTRSMDYQWGSETAGSAGSSYVEGLSEFQSFCEQMIGTDTGSNLRTESMGQSPAAYVKIEDEELIDTADYKEVASDVQLLTNHKSVEPLPAVQPTPPPKSGRRQKSVPVATSSSKSASSASPAVNRTRGVDKMTLRVHQIVEEYKKDKEQLSNWPIPFRFVLCCLFRRLKTKLIPIFVYVSGVQNLFRRRKPIGAT